MNNWLFQNWNLCPLFNIYYKFSCCIDITSKYSFSDTNDYQYHYTPQFSSKSSNYFDHYNNKDYFYHNLTGYPQPGQSINADYNNRNDVEYDYDYYNYNNYAQEPIPEPTKKTGIVGKISNRTGQSFQT